MYPGRYAATAPDRPAVHEVATGRVITYRRLEDASVRFAHWLREHGVGGVGDHIAVLTVNDATVFELYWGAVRSGVYITLVNTHLAPAEAAYIVDDCDAKVLVVSAPLAQLAGDIVPLTPKVVHRLAFGGPMPGHLVYEDEVAELSTVPPDDQPEAATCCTRPEPPGARRASGRRSAAPRSVTSRVLRCSTRCGGFGFDENTVYLSPAPIYHAAPLRYGASTSARRDGRAHGPVRSRALPGVHRAVPRHPQPVGAHAFRPDAEASGRGAGTIRPVVDEVRATLGGAVPPRRRQAGAHPLVG